MALLRELYRKSGAVAFSLPEEEFCAILRRIGEKYLPAGAKPSDQRAFFLSLRVEELALARACAAGHQQAWEVFLTRYREKLYEMSLRIVRESSRARQLADSLYAELYGMSSRDGVRVSKLSFYTGRGSLEGWLRTVLAQEHVNQYRRHKREISLDEESEDGAQFEAPQAEEIAAADPRLAAAVDEALNALAAEDRFVLAAYFLDDRTLAEVARTLRVHESTISRKLDKLTRTLRKQIMAGLGRRGMSRRQAQEALEVDVRDLRLDIRKNLSQDSGGRAFSGQKSPARGGDGSE
jgi:RNA polymerase sigma-70 factor (ECF subfamily)